MPQAEKPAFDYIIYTRTPWNEIPRSRHQFTTELAKRYRCLFIESNTISLQPSVSIEKIDNGLSVLHVCWWFHYKLRYRIPMLSNLYNRWLFKQIEKNYEIGKSVCVTFDHTSIEFNNAFEKSIYYATDDHTRAGAKKWNFFLKGQWSMEKKLLEQCRLVMVSAADLAQKFHPWKSKLITLPLAGPKLHDPPAEKIERSKPRVAFLAAFNHQRVPLDLVKSIGHSSGLQLICIGPVKPEFKQAVQACDSIEFTGPLTGEALYTMLRSCDAGIAPYRIDTVNSGVTPSKLWQYLACGLPAVATHLPSMLGLDVPSHLIAFSATNADFVELLKHELRSDNNMKRKERYTWSQQQTWESRIHTFVETCRERNLLP
jgi:glycosyltransferase involved in cell wall biosynthesis